ncbi:MAG: hypothetical protein AB7O49_19855 [Sphingomonadales bacterium]
MNGTPDRDTTKPGAFVRRVRMRARPGRAVGIVVDDFHVFSVLVRHDAGRVTAIRGKAWRYPWRTCVEAPRMLARLVGMALEPRGRAVYDATDYSAQCTHQFDVAGLTLAHAARGLGDGWFDCVVRDPVDGVRQAGLRSNLTGPLDWRIEGDIITEPALFAGQTPAAMGGWARQNFDGAEADAVLLLRQCVRTAQGRRMDIDSIARASDLGMSGVCYSFQPENAPRGDRMRGSVRDFSDLVDGV